MKTKSGFTIVELLIVIVIIAILAAITFVAFNGVQERAKTSKREHDLTLYYRAILAAHSNTGKTLKDITGSSWSAGACVKGGWGNPSNMEPKTLSKTSNCWRGYYDNLSKVGAAANMDLSNLKGGDANGNPYTLDENDGDSCNPDYIIYFAGDGTGTAINGRSVPRTVATC